MTLRDLFYEPEAEEFLDRTWVHAYWRNGKCIITYRDHPPPRLMRCWAAAALHLGALALALSAILYWKL